MDVCIQGIVQRILNGVNVLDLVTQVRDAVFVKCIFSSGRPQGVRILEQGAYGVEGVMGRSVYE